MNFRATFLSLPLAAALCLCPAASAKPARHQEAPLPKSQDVLALIGKEAAAEIAVLKQMEKDPAQAAIHRGPMSGSWITATFYIGASRLARVTGDADIRSFTARMAERQMFALRGQGTPVTLLNADNQAMGDLYEELYAYRRAPGILMPLKQRLDFALPYLTKSPAPEKLVWWWCDALFMAPPVLARMSALTGDPRYLTAMDTQWWRVYDRLYDPKEHLFFRDERFVTRRSDSGKKIFWSRGNGWVMAGTARVLESMPADFPSRPRYEVMFREMAFKLAKLQQKNGLWFTSLEDPKAYPADETSGTAFYTYAFAWGINHGLLPRQKYLPHVLKGWAALNAHILPSGVLGSVQPGGDQPFFTAPENTGLYASGAYILAGLEIAKLGGAVTPLPLAEPEKDENFARLAEPARPAPANAIEEANAKRWAAERQAMAEMPYDPEKDDPAYRSPVLPPIVGRADETVKLVPPTQAEMKPRAMARFVPERSDDIFWENDRVAHRIYGPALEKREPPSSSGIDVWTKRVRRPFMDRQLKTVIYHNDQGEGLDYYDVGASRGDGGLGIWLDNKLWTSRNFATYKILKNGPDVASFEASYAPWPVGLERKVWETRKFTLPMGTNFTRMVSTISSDKSEPMIVGIGLAKFATARTRGTLLADKDKGVVAYWETPNPAHGAIGTAVLVDPAMVVETGADADNNLIFIKVTPGKPFVYYVGSCWDQGLDFHSRAEWETYVKGQKPDFDPAH
jgi:rhamnogalacturonyl hydrolase YesR